LQFEARGLRVLPVSVDPLDKSQALIDRLTLPFPLGLDVDRSVTRAFGVYDAENDIAWPAIFIIAQSGEIRWRSLAETYPVRPAAQVILDAWDALDRR